MNLDIAKVYDQSVNDPEPDSLNLYPGWFWGLVDRKQDILPQWGDPTRQWQLRRYALNMHNTLVMGALVNIINRLIQTPWEIAGSAEHPRLVKQAQTLLQEAQYGEGWDAFLSRVLQDYLYLDHGAFIEVIGDGEPDTPLTGPVLGIAALDSLRCYVTGNWEHPVYFASHRTGKMHRLHWTRVYRMVDMPHPDPEYRGLGLSALSRAIAIANTQILMSRYNSQKLDDMPPKGIISISGISKKQYDDVQLFFDAEQNSRGNDTYKNFMTLHGVEPTEEVKVNMTPFSQLPDGFSYEEMMRTHVNLLALAIGEDPQEIWPLMGQAMGTGAQSRILHAKGRARTYGGLLVKLERLFNISILPRVLNISFKPKDSDQDKENAEIARAWVTNVVSAKREGILNQETAQRLLANTVIEYADVLLDESGGLRVPDTDVDEIEIALPDDEPQDNEDTTPANETTIQDDAPVVEVRRRHTIFKDIQAVRSNFELDFEDLLEGVLSGAIDRPRFGIVARALIARHGRAAYDEGLREGGVDPADKTDEELTEIDSLITSQSILVTEFSAELFGGELTPAQIEGKPAMWFQGSIMPFWNAGRISSDRNGMYEWVHADEGIEHCDDCIRLDGQIHRMSTWSKNNLIAGTVGQSTACGGWECHCRLVRREGAHASGRL